MSVRDKEPKDYNDTKLLDTVLHGAYPSMESVLDEWGKYVSEWRAPLGPVSTRGVCCLEGQA